MIINKFRLTLLFFFALFSTHLSAQIDYQAEFGVVGGGSYYLGDANNVLFANAQPAFGLFFRARFNPRISLRIEWNKTNIKGGTENTDPIVEPSGAITYPKPAFKNGVSAMDFCAEFNFFDLENNKNKRLSKRFSPYIFGGIGMLAYKSDNYAMTPSIPFGVGFKIKIDDRLNFNAQWAHRILMADNMENVASLNDPQGLNGSSVFNKDLLSTLTVGLSIDFWEKDCHCKNDNLKRFKPVKSKKPRR